MPVTQEKIAFLEGLVPQRNETQILLFRLLKLVFARKEALKKKDDQQRANVNAAFQLTVGATFSLWRAIVLAEKPFEPDTALNHAEDLLDRVVSFNTVAFTDEKATMQWMGGYYVTNIQFRLWRLSEFDNMRIGELLTYVNRWAPFSRQPSEFELREELDSPTFFNETIKCLKAIVDHLYVLTGGPEIVEG
jgi:hypothetical protein